MPRTPASAYLFNGQIWLQPDGAHPAFQVTHHPLGTPYTWPIVSPDGRTIAYGFNELIGPEHISSLHRPSPGVVARRTQDCLSRRSLRVVSRAGEARGYRLMESIGSPARLHWLDDGHLELTSDSGPHTFDLAARPPHPIP